jgi:hypothetical protein
MGGMKRLTLVALAMVVGMAIGAVVAAPDGGRAQDDGIAMSDDRLTALEQKVAFLENIVSDLSIDPMPKPVPAEDIGHFTVGESFTAENAFRLVCRIGELNTYYDLTCIRAAFP